MLGKNQRVGGDFTFLLKKNYNMMCRSLILIIILTLLNCNNTQKKMEIQL